MKRFWQSSYYLLEGFRQITSSKYIYSLHSSLTLGPPPTTGSQGPWHSRIWLPHLTPDISWYCPVMIFSFRASASLSLNGWVPLSNMYRTTPRDQQSDLQVYDCWVEIKLGLSCAKHVHVHVLSMLTNTNSELPNSYGCLLSHLLLGVWVSCSLVSTDTGWGD